MQKFKEKKKKDFCRISKIFSAKKLYICQLYLNIIQDKFSSTAPTHKCSNYKNFWWQRYKLQKLMMAKNTPRLQKIVFFILEKNRRSEVTISLQNSGKKQKCVYIFLEILLLFMQLDSILLTTSIFKSLPLL